MSTRTEQILISELWSTKTKITFREDPTKTPGQSFFELIQSFRDGKSISPIEVVEFGDKYVIQDGVRRSLAAKAAGKTKIEARVLQITIVGKPVGRIVPLASVLFPYDTRG